MGDPTSDTRHSSLKGKDPVTGERLTELLNPWVLNVDENISDQSAEDRRILFVENLQWNDLETVKAMFPDWQELTYPGDEYPKPRDPRPDDAASPQPDSIVKGTHGVLADTNDEDWASKVIASVRNARSNTE